MMLRRPDGSWSALLPLQPVEGSIDLDRVRTALQGLPQTQLVDIGGELGRMYDRYLGEARMQALLGALGVLLLMALVLRNTRRLLAVCQPLLLAVLLMLGALALLRVPLGILHLVGLLLMVAVGSNYALFFDQLTTTRDRGDGAADDDTLASLALANLTTVLSLRAASRCRTIPALSAIGRVVGAGRAAGAGAGGGVCAAAGGPARTGAAPAAPVTEFCGPEAPAACPALSPMAPVPSTPAAPRWPWPPALRASVGLHVAAGAALFVPGAEALGRWAAWC